MKPPQFSLLFPQSQTTMGIIPQPMRPIPYFIQAAAALLLVSTATAAAETTHPSPRMDTEARSIVQRMKRAHGGEANLDRILSIRVEGTIISENQTYDFVQIKKRPQYQRLALSRNRMEIIFGYDGDEVWRRGPHSPKDKTEAPEYVILDPDTMPGFIRDASILDHLFLSDTRVEFLGRTNELGFPCFRLRSTLRNGEQLEHLVDAETYLGVRLKPLNLPEEETVVTIFSDYRPVEGVQIPFSFSTIRDGEVESEVTIHRVTFNIGVYDAFFQIPGKVYVIEEEVKE